MNTDAMLVDSQCLADAIGQVPPAEVPRVFEHLQQQEPVLAGHIGESLIAIAGRLALSGAPTELVQGVHGDLLHLVLGALQALRFGHYRLWRECVPAERLPDPEVPPPAPPKVRGKLRKRRRDDDQEPEMPF